MLALDLKNRPKKKNFIKGFCNKGDENYMNIFFRFYAMSLKIS